MCDPISITVGLSAALAGFGAYGQAQAAQGQANYAAQVAANNAQVARWQQADALRRGEIEAQKQMQQQAQLEGAQRASLAANGLDPTSGTTTDILASTRFLGAQDVATIQSNAAREAWGYQVEAKNYDYESQLQRWRASQQNPMLQAGLAGVGSLLTSATNYALAGGFDKTYFKGDGPLKSYQNWW